MNNNVTVFDQQTAKYVTGMPIRSKEGVIELVHRDTHERIGIFNESDILNQYTNEAARELKNSGCPCVEAECVLYYCPVHGLVSEESKRVMRDTFRVDPIVPHYHGKDHRDIMDRDKVLEGQQRKQLIRDLQAAEDEVEKAIKALYLELPVKVAVNFHNLFFRYKTIVYDILPK